MFGSGQNPAQLYKRVSVDTGVSGASPHRLVELLFEAADDGLAAAHAAILADDPARKGEAITKVIRIVDEGLRATLNPQAGELADRLASLYDYILRRLLDANRTCSPEIIEEVRSLIGEIHSGWSGIADVVGQTEQEAQ